MLTSFKKKTPRITILKRDKSKTDKDIDYIIHSRIRGRVFRCAYLFHHPVLCGKNSHSRSSPSLKNNYLLLEEGFSSVQGEICCNLCQGPSSLPDLQSSNKFLWNKRTNPCVTEFICTGCEGGCDVIEGISESTLQYKKLRSDAVDRITHKLINLLTPNFRKRIS